MKNFKDIFAGILLCSAIAGIILFSSQARQGALYGLKMCEEAVIPSLLCVLVFANTLINSGGRRIFTVLFGSLCKRILRLPKCCAGAVVLGLCAGFPAGAMLTHSLYEKELIDTKIAARLMRFNFSGGLAFIITAVGSVSRGSIKTGLLLFLSNTLAALLFGGVCAPFYEKPEDKKADDTGVPFADAMTSAVQKTAESLLLMTAYIVLFCAISGIIKPPSELLPLLEITAGVCGKSYIANPLCAFYLAFGGICIHLQLVGFLRDMGVKYRSFLFGRLSCGALSYIICKALTPLFGDTVQASSSISQPLIRLSESTSAVSALMILGCGVMIFDIENRKSKLL
jgi:hypothetical protein